MTASLLPTTGRALSILYDLGYSHPILGKPEVSPAAEGDDISVGLIHNRGEPPTGLQIWCVAPGWKQSLRVVDMKNGAAARLMHSVLAQLTLPAQPAPRPDATELLIERPDPDPSPWPIDILPAVNELKAREDVLSVVPGPVFTPRQGGAELLDVCLGRGYVIRNFRLADGVVLQAHIIPDGVSIERLADRLGMNPPAPTASLRLRSAPLEQPKHSGQVETPAALTAVSAPTPPRPRTTLDTPRATSRTRRPALRRNTRQRTYAWFRSRTRTSIVTWVPTQRLHGRAAEWLIAQALVIPTVTCGPETMVIVLRVPLR